MQLLFPGFLWGLLACAIPVLVHLLQLRRPQRLLFTNTGFIRDIEFKNGRRRLQDILVLALRVAAVVLLVLAFCQPFIPVKYGVGSNRTVQLVVDNSPSMLQPGQLEQLSTQAVAAAQKIGASYGADARLQLVGYARRTVTKSAFERELFSSLSQKQQGWGALPVRQALYSGADEPLYIVSDFQKSELPSVELSKIPVKREIVLVPEQGQTVGNVYVDSVWLNDAFVRARAISSIHIRVRNGGNEEVRDCPVKVRLAGQQVAAYQVTIPAGQARETVVQAQVPVLNFVPGQVQVADAPVMFDNTYYFALRPATAIRVVEIGPVALTQAVYRQEKLFNYTYMPTQQINFGVLRQANLVLLTGLTAGDAGLREALVAVVRREGSVVVVPSTQAAAHESTAQLVRELGAGNMQWETVAASGPVQQEVAMPDGRSAFFREVFGAQARQAAMPSASPILRLAGGTDIMRLRGGEGFLTEAKQGAGRVYVFSSPFDKAYSNFTTHALFVPVLYRLAMLSYRDEQPLAYRIGQAAIGLRVAETSSAGEASPYRLVRDSLTLVPAQRQQGSQLRLEIPTELTQPGFYQVQRQGKNVATLAFNTVKAESELAAYSVAELRQLTSGHPNVHVLDAGEQAAALRSYRAGQTSQPLWRYCLLLALACLLAESVVLRWGRRVGQPAPASR